MANDVLTRAGGNTMKKSFMFVLVLAIAGCANGGQAAVDVAGKPAITTIEQVVEVEESTTTTQAPTTIPKATSTVPVTTVDPTVTPVPGSCLVLEERYCKEIKVIPDGNVTLAIINLPPETPVFSPFEGKVSYGRYSENNAFLVEVSEGTNAESTFRIAFTNAESISGKNYIMKGEILARVGEVNFDVKKFEAHNLIFFYIRNGIGTADCQC